MSGAANFGQCSDIRVCHGLMVGGTLVLDSDKNLKGINSIKSKDVIVKGCVSTPIVVGEDVLEGNVLVVSSSEDRVAVNSATNNDIAVIGIAGESGSAGQTINMCVGGEFRVRKSGSVTRGDFLASYGSSSAGIAYSTGTSGATGDFAIATSSANSSVDFVWARFKKSEVY